MKLKEGREYSNCHVRAPYAHDKGPAEMWRVYLIHCFWDLLCSHLMVLELFLPFKDYRYGLRSPVAEVQRERNSFRFKSPKSYKQEPSR